MVAEQSALDALISARVGGEPWAWFFVSGEGVPLPDGTEEASGNVVTASGNHFFFWTGWDGKHDCLKLDVWISWNPRDIWLESEEYRDARRQVGLP